MAYETGADLVTFIRQRLDEDEQVALGCVARRWQVNPENRHRVRVEPAEDAVGPSADIALVVGGEAPHIALHDPARVIADVAAQREIVDWAEHTFTLADRRPDSHTHRGAAEAYVKVLRHIAAVYADHADYRQEWRP